MPARTDLLAVGDALAARARGMVDDGSAELVQIGHVHFASIADIAQGARAAFEAAALVDVDPAPVTAALERFAVALDHAEVQAALEVSGPAEAIDVVVDLVRHYRREVAIGAALQLGFLRLETLAETLLRDFTVGDTDTSRRIAARIDTALSEAHESIENAKKEMQT